MSRHGIKRLLRKTGLEKLLQPTITSRHIRTIGSDESLLLEAISYNVNKNDRALYNLLHCAKLLNDAAHTLGETFSGKTILEIGTSREPGLPFILLLMGSQHYYASNILKLEPYRCARDDYSSGILLDANEVCVVAETSCLGVSVYAIVAASRAGIGC